MRCLVCSNVTNATSAVENSMRIFDAYELMDTILISSFSTTASTRLSSDATVWLTVLLLLVKGDACAYTALRYATRDASLRRLRCSLPRWTYSSTSWLLSYPMDTSATAPCSLRRYSKCFFTSSSVVSAGTLGMYAVYVPAVTTWASSELLV